MLSSDTAQAGKQASVFYPAGVIEKAKANAAKYPWAAAIQKQTVEAAAPWLKFSDDELRNLMFGATITRSWMVWSNGYCPACKQSVPMYTWEVDALNRPWKVRCPHCKEIFPKNDFYAFYLSGLDEHGVFDPKRADRSLLFNVEHPDPNDPLRTFGVDDGEGYLEGENRWRFIGAYLIYGQWKQAIVDGISRLAAAYVVTGDPAYAHKAGILLDRVADLYPTFDFGQQGKVYEQQGAAGYVSTWHDACEETRQMALAYDQVFEGLRTDAELISFLSRKAAQYGLENPKSSFADIQRNIEDRILRDALNNPAKTHTNYPRQPVAFAFINTILGWPENREVVYAIIDEMLEKATAVDGVTGEKGLSGYSSFTVAGMAELLARYSAMDATFLPEMLKRHPALANTYRFHIDLWFNQQYYPLSGDCGAFAAPSTAYCGAWFRRPASPTEPSVFSLFWRLYQATGDPAYVQVLYLADGKTLDGLPHDFYADDPEGFQKQVAEVIARVGPAPQVGSVNKQQWCLAMLRSGKGDNARALWLDYDSGGGHSHADGMNLGLFAKGLDLMPECGYPPVQYGGWGSPRSRWYAMTAAHNTVVVDGDNLDSAAGATTLWADGSTFRAIRASCPELIEGKQYERTAALIDISDRDSYVVDIFRVVGGADHAKFMQSHFGAVTTQGLTLQPAEDYGHETQMRNFRRDPSPKPGWSVDWKVEDHYKLLPPGADIHVRYTDLTADAQAYLCEGWIAVGGYNDTQEVWIPRVMVRRQAAQRPLSSTFVSVIEPYERRSNVARIRRLPLEAPAGVPYGDSFVAIEVQLADGRRDLLVAADAERPLALGHSAKEPPTMLQNDWGLRFQGDLCWIRLSEVGEVERLALYGAKSLALGDLRLEPQQGSDFLEMSYPSKP